MSARAGTSTPSATRRVLLTVPLTVPLTLVAVAAAGGCGAAGGGGEPAQAAPARPPSRAVRVGLSEWTVALSAPLAAGQVVLTVTNAGTVAHDLAVTGARVDAQTPVLPPGGRATLRIAAAPGQRLRLRCMITGHAAAGMDRTVTVAG